MYPMYIPPCWCRPRRSSLSSWTPQAGWSGTCKFKIGDYSLISFSLVLPVARCEEIEHCCDAKHYPAICICCEPFLIDCIKCFYHCWTEMWLRVKSVRTLQGQRSSPAKMRGRTKWPEWFLKSCVFISANFHYYIPSWFIFPCQV